MANYTLMYYRPGARTWMQAPLTGVAFNIGRTAENDLALDDPLVSHLHASLHIDERGVWILDRQSSNGILLNGLRLPPGEWKLLPLGVNFSIGATTLRVEAAPATAPSPRTTAPHLSGRTRPVSSPPQKGPTSRPSGVARLPLLGLVIVAACICLAGGGLAAWYFLPKLLTRGSQPVAWPLDDPLQQTAPTQTRGPQLAPPQVLDSLPASPGAGLVQDEQGVSLLVPENSLENGQQAFLERANLSRGMQAEIEKAYQVESLVYAVRLQDGQDGAGRMELSLPSPSPEARLAVLVSDRYLGILETAAQDGVFRVAPGLTAPAVEPGYTEPEGAALAPNRYLVLTPKPGSTQAPQGSAKLASLLPQSSAEGKSCISKFWTVNHCWRNAEGSVYVFWEDDVPPSLKDQEYLRIEDAIEAVTGIMSSYQQRGFIAAAISPSNPAYLIIEAAAPEPYYSFKTGNVYLPWDIIGGIGEAANRCNVAHEFFHWIEDEAYVMGAAALSNSKSWWQEASAENGAFLLYPECVEQNLTKYGIVTTSGEILGFQAAPFQWEGGEQARYIHALQFYLSLCEGGANCALSQAAWVQAINTGAYPMEGAAATAYMRNAKDLGRFLLGAAPQESRVDAVLPPSVASGNHYGDYLTLKTGGRSTWDYGMTLNQFKPAGEQELAVSAQIEQGGVYPLWIGNGPGTPIGGAGGHTGPPGVLEILPGAAFWMRLDQNEPVFYPAGSSLKLGPISDKLGTGAARIVAIAPEGADTFQAKVSLADFAGDWSAEAMNGSVTPINCPGYSAEEAGESGVSADQLLQLFSGYGEYAREAPDSTNLNLIWNGTLAEGLTGSSEVTVEADKITLHYRLEIPKPTESSFNWIPGMQVPLRFRLLAGGLNSQSVVLAASPGLVLLAGAAWLRRRRRTLTWLAIAMLISGGLLLTGCFGISIWGTIDATYTFHHVEYIGPQPGETQESAEEQSQSPVIWKLSDGQVKYDMDLTMLIVTEDEEGNSVEEIAPCQLTATGSATASISPEGTIPATDFGE